MKNKIVKVLYFILFINLLSSTYAKSESDPESFSSVKTNSAVPSRYGPLIIDFSNAVQKNGRFILPSKNTKGQKLYIAISCPKQKINLTSNDYAWRSWFYPSFEFEYNLINDICKNIYRN